jgi:hypothetical protein
MYMTQMCTNENAFTRIKSCFFYPPSVGLRKKRRPSEQEPNGAEFLRMRQLVVRGLSGQSACISLGSGDCSVEEVQERIFSSVGVPPDQQKLVIGGKILTQDVLDSVSASDIIFVSLSVRVLGGKGGFGSLLRGGQGGVGTKKITNFGSMRDLQGRRMKDVVRLQNHTAGFG